MKNNGIDWTTYSQSYDDLCDVIPAYEENISMVLDAISSCTKSDQPSILDIGAGTGNYIKAVHSVLPGARFVHLDANTAMNERARLKYSELDINVTVVEEYAQRADFAEESFDIVLCINVLYTLHPQGAMLDKIRRWLSQDGAFLVLDFGRQQRPFDWGLYLFNSLLRQGRLGDLIRLVRSTRTHTSNARDGAAGQKAGNYWLHTTAEFGDFLHRAGFDVRTLRSCYRDYADFAVCSKQ